MEVLTTPLKGLLIIKPNIFKDKRGYFFESWNRELYKKIGVDYDFVQDNQSLSKKNVLRGLHFQNPPYEQGKLVHVIKGAVIDFAVDIRSKSATYGQYYSIMLSEDNHTFFWIPPGFAHGFVSLKNNTIFSYKCTNVFNKSSECSLSWDDPDLNIDWKIKNPIISEKDLQSISFKDLKSQF